MADLIQLRRDKLSVWNSVNPTLGLGEVGLIQVEGTGSALTNPIQFKVGDGSTDWNSLPMQNGSAINTIKVNGVELTIDANRGVDVVVKASGSLGTSVSGSTIAFVDATGVVRNSSINVANTSGSSTSSLMTQAAISESIGALSGSVSSSIANVGESISELSGSVSSSFASVEEAIADIEENIEENYARIDGSYDSMAVGMSKNLEGRKVVTDTFLQRSTGGEAEVANGTAQVMQVEGNSVKFNQLANLEMTVNHCTRTYNNGYTTCVLTNENSQVRMSYGYSQKGFSAGDKILRIAHVPEYHVANASFGLININTVWNSTKGTLAIDPDSGVTYRSTDTIAVISTIFTNTEPDDSCGFYFDLNNANGFEHTTNDYFVASYNIFNLTKMFGAGNEPATPEQVESWLAENIGAQAYYPYTEGVVLNNSMEGIETFSRNLLNPDTNDAIILGKYDTDDLYGNYYGISGTYTSLSFTDAYGNVSTITPDSDGKFEILVPGTLHVTGASSDTCVFIWWDGTQTDYVEYKDNKAYLDIPHIYGKKNGTGELVRVWPTGAPGLGDLKDSLYVEDGKVVARRVMGEVDMGNLGWQRTDTSISGKYRFIADMPTEAKRGASTINSKYNLVGSTYSNPKTGYVISGKQIIVYDEAYATLDEAAFKAAMSGVLLYFELDTPEVYTDLVYQGSEHFADNTPVTLPVNYQVDNWGIERIIPQNSSSALLTAPATLSCKYSIDAVESLDTMEKEIDKLHEDDAALDAKKADKIGSYPQMNVGTAKALEGDNTVPAEYVFREVPTGAATGLAQLMQIRGKSLVWNQLIHNGDFSDGTTGWYAYNSTIAIQDGVMRVSYDGSDPSVWLFQQGVYPIGVTKKVFCSALVKCSKALRAGFSWWNANSQLTTLVAGQWTRVTGMMTVTPDGIASTRLCVLVNSLSEGDYYDVKSVSCIDLTLMFGAGNEPATVEEFEQYFPAPYYAYNEGTIISNKVEKIVTVGFNQWDEEWEEGIYDSKTGQPIARTQQIRSKNPIRIIGGETYYAHIGSSKYLRLYFYDVNMTFISSEATSAAIGGTITAPANAVFCNIATGQYYGTTYNHDICINISNSAKNGTYEPYEKHELELNLPTLTGKLNGEGESVTIIPDGAKGAGTAYDYGVVENGYLTKIVKVMGSVDLGTLEFIKHTIYTNGFATAVNAIQNLANSMNILCGKYVNSGKQNSAYNGEDKQFFANEGLNIWFYDSGYAGSTAEQFKAAMNGVMLYYELATPEVYVLDTPVYVGYQVTSGSTEAIEPQGVDTNGVPKTTPFVCTVKYAIDAVGTIVNLPINYMSKESMIAFLEAMKTAGIIASYTMSFDSGTQKYAFTITAPSTE